MHSTGIYEIKNTVNGKRYGALQRHMAEEYRIRQSCVSEIVRGVSYAWVN